MMIMSHIGDPDTWYNGKYAADVPKFGLREDHSRITRNTSRFVPHYFAD